MKSQLPNAMMAYHWGEADVDQMSDKHKISLFDDSRYEDNTLEMRKGSITMGLEEYSTKPLKILKSNNHGDSLYDE